MSSVAPTVAMIAALVLAGAGVRMLWTGGNRQKGVLMLVAAAVLLGNVVIWTW